MILCKFGQICATGNAFVRLIVGRNSILNFLAKIWTGMCRVLLCGDDLSHSQGQSGKRLLLASRGHPIRTLLYHGSCIDLTHQSHTLDPTPGVPFPITHLPIQLLIKDTCRECLCEPNCWQELHFESSRQNLNRNVQSHYVWWWLITQPRPIWKKAPPGLQRPSRTESLSGLSSGTLMVRTHTLDLTPVAPRSYNPVAIQLLIKDT